MQVLKNLLVISLEQAVAAPFLSSKLADAGARVIKVERPEGDFARNYDNVVNGHSAYFVWLNRGKESITLDLKEKKDLHLLNLMIKKADVLIENLKPGSMTKLGINLDDLRKINPRLITCSISGYGNHGNWSKMKAYDLLIQAETGMSSITGTKNSEGRVGVSIADIAAGMYSWSAILEALIARGISGLGKHIDVSLFDSMADWMSVPLLWYEYGGKIPERVGMAHPSICPYGAFKTVDGKIILLSIQNEREWTRFCSDFLEDKNFAKKYPDNSIRLKNRQKIDNRVATKISKMLHSETSIKLKKAEIAYGTLNNLNGLSNHPVLRRAIISTPEADIQIPAPPAISDKNPHEKLGNVPMLNQHGESIRVEFSKKHDLSDEK